MCTIGLQEDHSRILYTCTSFSPDGRNREAQLVGFTDRHFVEHCHGSLQCNLMLFHKGTRIISKEQVILDAQTLLPVQAAEISKPHSSIHLLDDG